MNAAIVPVRNMYGEGKEEYPMKKGKNTNGNDYLKKKTRGKDRYSM